jgi:hypothetical protein
VRDFFHRTRQYFKEKSSIPLKKVHGGDSLSKICSKTHDFHFFAGFWRFLAVFGGFSPTE